MPQPLGSCIILFDSSTNSILLGKRINSYKAGLYGLPGGRLEVHEKVEDAAERELIEETGLSATKVERVGLVKEAQDGYDFLHFVFVCQEWNGQPMCVEPEKCEGWEWFAIENLPRDILPGHRAGIEMWMEKREWLVEM